MNPTQADVETSLRLLRAGYPGYNPQIDAETTALWHLALGFTTGPVVIAAATSWVQQEERFPSLTEFMGECKSAERKMARTELGSGARPLERCPECGDGDGWVLVSESGPGTYRPCSRCHTDAWRRRNEGHYGPDHDCEECRDIRRGPAGRGR